jgi:hypothetical protein
VWHFSDLLHGQGSRKTATECRIGRDLFLVHCHCSSGGWLDLLGLACQHTAIVIVILTLFVLVRMFYPQVVIGLYLYSSMRMRMRSNTGTRLGTIRGLLVAPSVLHGYFERFNNVIPKCILVVLEVMARTAPVTIDDRSLTKSRLMCVSW